MKSLNLIGIDKCKRVVTVLFSKLTHDKLFLPPTLMEIGLKSQFYRFPYADKNAKNFSSLQKFSFMIPAFEIEYILIAQCPPHICS